MSGLSVDYPKTLINYFRIKKIYKITVRNVFLLALKGCLSKNLDEMLISVVGKEYKAFKTLKEQIIAQRILKMH